MVGGDRRVLEPAGGAYDRLGNRHGMLRTWTDRVPYRPEAGYSFDRTLAGTLAESKLSMGRHLTFCAMEPPKMTQPPSTRVANQAMEGVEATSATATDDELASFPKPPRRMRTVSLVLMSVAGLAAISMALLLFSDVRYALSAEVPVDVGNLATLSPSAELRNAFVQGEGRLKVDGALHYERLLEPDSFLLAPIAGNDRLWVEMRAPTPPSTATPGTPLANFVGRLVPVQERGFRSGGTAHAANGANVTPVPSTAWVLLDGITPQSLRWTVPLLILFVAFAAFCSFNIVRIVRPVRG